jgi:hypothetical protein
MFRGVANHLSYGQIIGYFLDTCILLPQPMESSSKARDRFLNENKEKCHISSSVKEEALSLIDRSYGLVISAIRSRIKPFLEKEGVKEITKRDGKLFAKFFSERKRYLKRLSRTKSNVRYEILSEIESYVAPRIHSLKRGQKISVYDFLANLIAEMSQIKFKLETRFKTINCITINPDDSIVCCVESMASVQNKHDAEHLASAITYQFEQNKWVVFVTNDDVDILSKEKVLFDCFILHCVKPEWAHDYFVEITKLKPPINFYNGLTVYSKQQKTFGIFIEKVLKKKILA